MIKNVLHYRSAQTRLREFEKSLAENRDKPAPRDTHPIMWKSYVDGIERQIETFRQEIEEYDALSSGTVSEIVVNTLEELPVGLIKARIARKINHKDLATRLGLKPQQIQRWEDNDYSRIQKI